MQIKIVQPDIYSEYTNRISQHYSKYEGGFKKIENTYFQKNRKAVLNLYVNTEAARLRSCFLKNWYFKMNVASLLQRALCVIASSCIDSIFLFYFFNIHYKQKQATENVEEVRVLFQLWVMYAVFRGKAGCISPVRQTQGREWPQN